MHMTSKLTTAVAVFGLIATATIANARPNRVRAAGQNGSIGVISGPNGSAMRTRGAVQNADGSVTSGRAGGFKAANGATGGRASTTTVNPDGSANRRSMRGASGAAGNYATASDVTRNADGTYSGGRTTSATNAATGNTYNGSTQIDPATGKPVRTATCTDAAGNSIACPR